MKNWFKGIGLSLMIVFSIIFLAFLFTSFPYVFPYLVVVGLFLAASYCFKNVFDFYDGRKKK